MENLSFCPSFWYQAIELKSYSQTIKLLKSLFVGSTAEALLTCQFVFTFSELFNIGGYLKADRQSTSREQKRPWSAHWSLVTAICVAVAFKGSTFLGWRSGKKFGMMFVCCQLRGLAHCIWCPTPPAPSKLHAETKWHFANRFIKIESRELFVSDMKRQAWQQEKIFRYYLFSVSTIDRN